jgi:phosphatidylserine/phosphatidylglycerophosphate/cardiolipin synthase-like enzyme
VPAVLRHTAWSLALVAGWFLTGCSPEAFPDEAPDQGDVEAQEQAAGSCDPYQKRNPAPLVLIGPDDFEPELLALIDSAQTSLDVMMYQLTRTSFVNALVAAANRGVAVRVLLDPDEGTSNTSRKKMIAAGAEVRDAPDDFAYAHAKVVIVDADLAAILSGNMNYHTMVSERNYAVLDRANDDVADAMAIFEHDWSGAELDLACTRLVVAPDNARERLVAHVKSADDRLDMALMYLSDATMRSEVKKRAQAGVAVRVLLANPAWMPSNAGVADQLIAAGAEARFMTDYDLHAKLIIADDAAFVGSENMSFTSLTQNREVGVFIREKKSRTPIDEQFEDDWAAGVIP